MNVIYSMRSTITRLFAVSVLSLTSHIASAVPLQPGLLFDPQFQVCLEETALTNGWTLTEEVTVLSCSDRNIENMAGVEVFTNLIELDLSANQISQTIPLDQLAQLSKLNLSNNRLVDIYSLQILTGLTHLNLSGNHGLNPADVQQLVFNNGLLTHLGVADIAMGELTRRADSSVGDLNWLPLPVFSGVFNLIELDISNTGSIMDLDPLFQYPNLRVLRSAGNQLQSTWPLDQLLQLEVLDLSNNNLRDLFPLQMLSGLTQLNLSGNRTLNPGEVQLIIANNVQLTHLGVADIAMGELSVLDPYNPNPTVGDLNWLPVPGGVGEYNLIELDISNTGPIMDLNPLFQYPNLRVLRSAGNQLQSTWPVDQLLQLEVLDLSDNQLSDVYQLQVLNSLIQLNLSGNQRLSPMDVQHIIFNNVQLTHLGVADIAMGELSINDPYSPTPGVGNLNWLPVPGAAGEYNLIELDIRNTGPIMDLGPVSQYTNLRVLKSSGNQLQYAWPVDQLWQLEELDLGNNKLQDIQPLQMLNRLTQLNLSGNHRLNPAEVKQIIDNNVQLTHLGVANIAMGELSINDPYAPAPGVGNLNWLPTPGSMGEFNLLELDISNTGPVFDLYPLFQYPNLRVLKSSGNSVQFAWPLEQLLKLQVLDLSDNQLQDIYALQFLTVLTQLNLSGNQRLNPAEVKQIIDNNVQLTHLGVAGIAMGELTVNDPYAPDPGMGNLNWLPVPGGIGEYNLVELDISNTGSLMDLGSLPLYTDLRVLKSAGNDLQNVWPLDQLLKLDVLDLSDNKLLDVYPLLMLTQLTQLNLSGNQRLNPTEVKQVIDNNVQLTHLGVADIAMGELIINDPYSSLPLTGTLNWLPVPGGVGEFNLLELDISNTGTILDLGSLYLYQNLRVLKLAENNLQNVWSLDQLLKLEVLDLSNNKLLDINPLQILTQLTQLNLSGNTHLNPVDVQVVINNNVQLTHLGVADIAMGELTINDPYALYPGMGNLHWLPMPGSMGEYNLVELDISNTGSIMDLDPLFQYPNLRVLRSAGNKLQYIWPLDQLLQLEVLDLSNNNLQDLYPLQMLRGLTQLNLSGNQTLNPGEVQQVIANNVQLTHLGVADIAMGELSVLDPYSPNPTVGDLNWLPAPGGVGEYNLIELDISNTGPVMDLISVSYYPNLRVLKSSGNHVQYAWALEQLVKLEVLDLSNNDLSDVTSLQSLQNLQQLNLSNNKSVDPYIPGIDLLTLNQIITANPGITHLSIAGVPMGDLNQLAVFNNPHSSLPYPLVELDISNTGLTDLISLSAIPSLRVIKASDNNLAATYGLEQLHQLQQLDVSNNALTDIYALQMIYELRQLNLSGNHLVLPFDVQIAVQANPGLTHIGVADIQMGSLSWLPPLGYQGEYNLEELDISSTGADPDVSMLSQYSNLTVLKAANNAIEKIWSFDQLKSLQVLDLSNNRLFDIESLKLLTNLVELNLSNNVLPDPYVPGVELYSINQVIDANQGLTHLGVAGVYIGILDQLAIFVTGISHNIVELDVSHSGIMNLNAVSGMASLRVLKATDNLITDISPLNQMLQLKVLDLSNNDIQYVIALGDLVNLDLLDLSGNNNIQCVELDQLEAQFTLLPGEFIRPLSCNVLNPPTVSIVEPVWDVVDYETSLIALLANATDLEDGNLDAAIQWSSNLMGIIGTGASVEVSLIAGDHIITASAIDSHGNTGTSTVLNITVLPNTAPEMLPFSSNDGAIFNEGLIIGIVAGASDQEDGDISHLIRWSSNIDGYLGTGSNVTVPLSVGNHIITASVTDSAGATASRTLLITINSLPQLNILSPLDASLYNQGDSIVLTATAIDAEDGLLDASIIWSSNIDGMLGAGAQLTQTLSAGVHTVSASITDSMGATVVRTLTLNVNGIPQLTLLAPLTGSLHQQGDSISLAASANDIEDGDLGASIVWSSSLDGPLGSGIQLTKVLSVGSHIITASVTDSAGIISTQSITLSVNGLPQLNLLTPSAGGLYQQGDSVTFSATASDIEDGVIDANISWSSSLDGLIGSGAQLTKVLSVGSHIITASITDSAGITTTQTVTVSVNGLPQVTLLTPLTGSLYQQGDSVTLSATASDIEDGILSASVIWSSSVDGLLGTGAQLVKVLSVGNHVITASITDSMGGISTQTSLVTVNSQPQVTIQSPLSGSLFMLQESVNLTAAANDLEDGNIAANIQWSSNLDGALGAGPTLNTNLSLGAHTLTASITDSVGGKHSVTTQLEIDQIDLGAVVSGNGRKQYATLTWSASRTAVDIYKDGVVVATGASSGSTVLRFKYKATFKVCESATNNCSVDVVAGM